MPDDCSVRLQDRQVDADRGPEDTAIQLQNLHNLTLHMIDKRLRRRVTRGDDPGCFDHGPTFGVSIGMDVCGQLV